MQLLKGQSSIEFVIMMSIALLISAPFIVSAQSSVIDINTASKFLDIDNSLQEIEENVEQLQVKSYPARRIINFNSPTGIQKIHNPQFTNTSALVIEINNNGQPVNRSIIFENHVYLENTTKLESEGLNKLLIKKYSNSINISVIN